jgi:topoisomerase (DNA) II binding protein 1
MDGVKTLCSGFEKSEKVHVSVLPLMLQFSIIKTLIFISSLFLFLQVRIEELVTAMGGHLLTRHSMDVDFVIVKDVTVAKYKVSYPSFENPC